MKESTGRFRRKACRVWPIAGALSLSLLCGCSIKGIAVNMLGDALAQSGSVYSRDDDPELVGAAIPFALKTIEGLVEASPNHTGLLSAAASGFTQYAYVYVASEADYVEDRDLAAATALRDRALKLYRRGLEYGLRGLEASLPGFRAELRSNPGTALSRATKEHVPLLYWTAGAWGSAISLALHDTELSADLGLAAALMERALSLDEGYGGGAVHDFFIAYDGGRPASAGGSVQRAKAHLNSALRLSNGLRAAPLVTYAESVSKGAQDREEFTRLLKQALAIDVDRAPDQRLANLVSQRRARWLLGKTDELFIE